MKRSGEKEEEKEVEEVGSEQDAVRGVRRREEAHKERVKRKSLSVEQRVTNLYQLTSNLDSKPSDI